MPDPLSAFQAAVGARYLLQRELGSGGMATVYLAEDRKHGRPVAVKVLKPELATSVTAERFLREIEVSARLHHPHILSLYDSGEANGFLYYVMPFVEGESLRDRLDREHQLPVADAVAIALAAAGALGHAHARGIVHRDIKPENIMLSGEHTLVADFGIASAAGAAGQHKLTHTGLAIGTPLYMAPEQAGGEGEEVGPTADIYSLGCVLYEMLAGEPPFTGKSAVAIMARHAMEEVPSIRIIRSSVPKEVEAAIFHAMGKVPADRPQTAAQFAEMLGAPVGTTAKVQAPGELPVQLTTLIGREREVSAVRDILGATRLLTLTGAGGSGKTRLALEVAAQMASDYPDGVAWVELASLSDPDLVAPQVATVLAVREEVGRSATEALLFALRKRTLLLVLDNCEHLVEASAALADTLLRGCPNLRILATSREAIGVAGERAWLVPPLSLPDAVTGEAAERLLEFEAVQLFVARAQDVLPTFVLTQSNATAVAQVCRRLDGLPLAIELAAARVRVLAPEQIAERLHNVFALLTSGKRTALPRQRTLRATIDWSYQLLTQPEQLLFQRLSVFASGFTIEAVEAVCTNERLDAGDVLDVLTRLVDRSLVVMREQEGASRYHLLETVRQYAAELFARAEDAAATRRRHAEFYLTFAESAEPHIYMGGTGRTWLHRIDAEIGNIRAATEWLDGDAAGAEQQLRLATSLRWYWYQRETAEGRRQIDRALARGGTHSPHVRGRAQLALGTIAFWQGDITAMQAPLAEAIAIARDEGDEHLLAEARTWHALGLTHLDQLEQALAGVDEALPLARRIGGPLLVGVTSSAGYITQRRGDLTAARELAETATQLARYLGLSWAALTISNNLARLAFAQGDFAAAAAHWHAGLGLDVELHQRWGAPFAVEGLALLAFARGEARTAAQLLGGADAVRETIGTALRPFDDRPHIEQIRAALGGAAFEAAVAEGRALSTAQAIDMAADVARQAAGPALVPPAAAAPPESAGALMSRSAPGSAAASAAPALRVRALGPLLIELEGSPLPADAWTYAKPRELLLYLLAHPEGRTREQIGLIFWPDSSAAQVKNRFHVTLHHLRKVLGRADWIVFEQERYRINPALAYEFDAGQFEREMSAALREARAGRRSAERLRAALTLYRGDFLDDETVGDWHLEIRDRLRRLYTEGAMALGHLLLAAEAHAEATEVFRELVRRDDLHEEAHRCLMQSLARAGDRGQAVRQYERLVGLLRRELDAEPDPETATLYERLKRAERI